MSSKSDSKRGRVADEDRAVVHRLFERVYSKGELNLIDELVASDFTGYSTESSDLYLGPVGVKTHVRRLRTAFHGFTIEIDDLYVEGDTFEGSWTARGTHEQRYVGVEPTCTIGQAGEEPHGNRVTVTGVASGTIRNDKIHELRMRWDVETLRRQLGSSTEAAKIGSHPEKTRMATIAERRINSINTSILVVLDFDDPATTLRAVMGDPATIDAEFHLLMVVPMAEYEARRRARIDAGVTGPYTVDHLTEEAHDIAQRVGCEYLDTDGAGFEAIGAVGRTRDYVSKAVRTHDYGRVYVAERPRPVWQRLLGVKDLPTELVRALPDVVTVVSAADVLGPVREESDSEVAFGPETESTTWSTDR